MLENKLNALSLDTEAGYKDTFNEFLCREHAKLSMEQDQFARIKDRLQQFEDMLQRNLLQNYESPRELLCPRSGRRYRLAIRQDASR